MTADEQFRQMQQAAEMSRQKEAYAKAQAAAKPSGLWDALNNLVETGQIGKAVDPNLVPVDQRINMQVGKHQFGR